MTTPATTPAAPAPALAPPPAPAPAPAPASTQEPGARTDGRRKLDWRLRFAFLSLVWGFSFLFIKVGTEGYAPFQVTFGRLLFGTAVVAVVLVVKRERLPRSPRT
ncbi:EamA family transporter, partial [Streptomyces sp. NPDC059063]